MSSRNNGFKDKGLFSKKTSYNPRNDYESTVYSFKYLPFELEIAHHRNAAKGFKEAFAYMAFGAAAVIYLASMYSCHNLSYQSRQIQMEKTIDVQPQDVPLDKRLGD